jgi:NAD(P)-dependent dehydrogenase (short-subunit alcohol dehydrogenase family)
MRESFDGKIAIITGGASGIGAALGRALARHGAEVILADRQELLAASVARDIGPHARGVALDVRDLAATRALVDETVTRHGAIDLFFANAGIGVGGEAHRFSEKDWDDVLDVNVRGVTNGVVAVYPQMVRQGRGHIVATASMAGLVPGAGEASYVAAKHAVVGLTKALRVEAKRHGVRVSALCPGAIRTPILTGGVYGRIDFGLSPAQMEGLWERVRPMDVDAFAEASLKDVLRNVPFIIHPKWWRLLWYVDRISPRASLAIWRRLFDEVRGEVLKNEAKRGREAS